MPKPPPKPPIGQLNKQRQCAALTWLRFTVADLFLWACIGFAVGLTAAGYL